MIESLLVANRGEIACRVFRTCRARGIATVAVHSDADAGALHAREADAAVRLPGAAPADTYLRGDLIVKAALAAGADAVHPGYGFLSENAEFARAVLDAGLVWVGPPPGAIEAMASKTRAKELMAAARVPLLAPVDPATAAEADLPLLLKAAAGGGGRGMRIVRELASLEEELTAASAEATSAFGDGEVFAEPYVERGRHVEVQILADAHGTVWALGTRDCSLQRRHQKVIEESPAPGLPDALRAVLREAAVAAARAVGYRGAGTVEFLISPQGRPYFLEMNTRLQVEHPVTEEVFGLDLVALQLAVAEGAALPVEPPAAEGHAVEARLYAEDPAAGWAPQTGRLHALEVPGRELFPVAAAAPRLRVDTGYRDGDTIGVHYDSLLAKVIVWAPTRAEALRALRHALRRARVHGPGTNRELLVRSLGHPDVIDGRFDTGFYERHLDALTTPVPGERHAAVAAALADAAARTTGDTLPARLGGWRNVGAPAQRKTYGDHEARYRATREGFVVEADEGDEADDGDEVRVIAAAPHRVSLEIGGVVRHFDVRTYGDEIHVDSATGAHRLIARPRFRETGHRPPPGSLLAPMPGTVVRLAPGLAEGARVTAGQPLIWLEAMKMEHRVTAPASGTLTALHAVPGRQVEVGALLAVVTDPDAQDAQEESS
ncbi:acety-l/propionyl-CoA carboxylase subunit alpha [Streptomyces scopuliridis]|uniref:acetyl/propionyl/methylcrotonyl-CoA carboxylase subunit alpha n=1 Tax=Streptomyces scopuliridis TaxID=452529 RepID=UPI002DD8822F|nr:biotin carboxylase N-terminal domain-containing protein [Streptomyces scopuliridis]WSB35248.1 acety-l/propionyl-CoA carboxylase subunit alpha [Streptomyces scopuliridis]